jgi:hypothetical protein
VNRSGFALAACFVRIETQLQRHFLRHAHECGAGIDQGADGHAMAAEQIGQAQIGIGRTHRASPDSG